MLICLGTQHRLRFSKPVSGAVDILSDKMRILTLGCTLRRDVFFFFGDRGGTAQFSK
jgi:hypothetical protein